AEQVAGVGEPVGQGRTGQAHGEHAVGDDAGQSGLGGDPVVVVDRVEVQRGARVAHQGGTVQVPARVEQFGSALDGGAQLGHDSSPRTARVETTVHTGSAARVATSVRVVTMARAERSLTSSTVTVVCSMSPATIGRW